MGFTFTPIQPNTFAKREGDAEQKTERYPRLFAEDAPEIMSLKERGDYRIRILPPSWEDTDGSPFIKTAIYYGVGADDVSFLSRRISHEHAAVRKYHPELTDDDPLYPHIKTKDTSPIRFSPVWLCYVIDRNAGDDAVKIMKMPRVLGERIGELIERDKVWGLADLNRGFDVRFTKSGTGKDTSYDNVEISRQSTPVARDDNAEVGILRSLEEKPLPSVFKFYEPDYIAECFGDNKTKENDKKGQATRF